MKRMQWEPIIRQGKAKAICIEIAQNTEFNRLKVTDNSLLAGKCGLNIFNFLLGNHLGRESITEIAATDTVKFIHTPNSIKTYTFCSGLSGCSWAIGFMQNERWIDFGNPFKCYHKELYEISIESLKQRYFDYLHGSLGICLNALQSLDNEAKKYLHEVVNLLGKNSDKSTDGMPWKNIEIESKIPIYNLGLSHGIPSIVTIISYIYETGIEKRKCLELLDGSINWMLQQKFSKELLSIFPYTVPVVKPANYQSVPSRMAWCYGDLGIARSIWLAGKATDNAQWKRESISIMLHASKRKNLKENMVFDAGLCHGSAGIAHIFNRFYQDTQIEAFKEAAIYWYEVTLDFARFEDGIGGYKTYVPAKSENEVGQWENSIGLLEGSTGIGLALFAAISNEEPTWDRCLLLS